ILPQADHHEGSARALKRHGPALVSLFALQAPAFGVAKGNAPVVEFGDHTAPPSTAPRRKCYCNHRQWRAIGPHFQSPTRQQGRPQPLADASGSEKRVLTETGMHPRAARRLYLDNGWAIIPALRRLTADSTSL